ncbi:MAG: hypothetical protein ACRC5C_11465, partial [Bacilli bacterium]
KTLAEKQRERKIEDMRKVLHKTKPYNVLQSQDPLNIHGSPNKPETPLMFGQSSNKSFITKQIDSSKVNHGFKETIRRKHQTIAKQYQGWTLQDIVEDRYRKKATAGNPKFWDKVDKAIDKGKAPELKRRGNKELRSALNSKFGWGARFSGAGIGLATAMFDAEDDDITSAGGKMLKGLAITQGAGLIAEGVLQVSDHHGYDVKRLINRDTVGKLMVSNATKAKMDQDKKVIKIKRAKLEKVQKQSMNVRVNREVGKFTKVGGHFKTGIGVAIAAIGIASVIDIGDRISDGNEAEKLRVIQEKELSMKQKRDKKKNRELNNANINMGEMAFELFNARSGHHKMGNAKYY